ncbi:MAG: hypothetical protein GTO60_08455 [Gammaproteobacteria bacterium]|nr:hypothetical protein [Gammaproteobacteria bacterium]
MTVSNCDFLFCQTGCNFNQNSAYTVSLIDSILYFCLLGVIKHATPTVNITYCCFNSNVTDVSGVTKGTGCITGAPELVNPSADPPDLRLKSTSACIGVSSTSNDIGAVQYVQIPPGVPTITAAPNADEESIDVTLAAMPAGASQVKLYKRTSTGFDSLVHTFTGTGTYQDDNGGSGYSIYRVVRYIAIADDGLDTFYSLPSLDVLEQVGTSLKFTRAAFIERIKDMLATEAAISTSRLYGYKIVTEKRDPNPFRKSIYIVDGSPEFPEIQYATQRMENQLPIDILIMRKTAVSAPGKRANDLVVERVLQLLAINYRWNENCYDTLIEEVEPYDEREGATPHFPVARITLRGLSQYMRFQP